MKFVSSLAENFLQACGNRNVRRLAVFSVLLLSFSILAFGQDATVVGTITDPSGSVVPNVTVTVIQAETGKTTSVKTGPEGNYVLPNLQIGNYNLKAEASGFAVAEKKGIVLNVGDRLRFDIAMKLGTTSESVTVEENAVKVQSESGEVSDVITGKQVTQLATNGRSIYTLVNLTPGASSLQGDFQTPTPVGGDANVSFNGNRPGHTIYLLDGGEDLDRGGGGTFSVMPSLDSIAEFRALTSSYDAEYGLSSSATFTTVLKSGTSKLHASAWEFDRNDWFNARDFTHAKGTPMQILRFNTYGFNVGGPVDFWKKEHKTFFFYNMEWRALRQGGSSNVQVPLASEYPTAAGAVIPASIEGHAVNLTVPTSIAPATLFRNCPGGVAPAGVTPGSAFPSNTIPACMIDANAAALLGAGIFVKPNNQAHFVGGASVPTDVREEIVRVDHQFTDKFSVFGHYIAEKINQGFLTTQWSGDNQPSIGNDFGNPSYSGVVHTTYTISPTLLNETAFNYNGNRIHIIPKGVWAAPSGFTFNRLFTGPNPGPAIPSVNLSQFTGSNYTSNWLPWNNKADDYQLRDDISWTKGAHQLKFGGSWALYKKIQDLFAPVQGGFNFDGSVSGYDYADFLLGYSNNYSENAVKDSGHWNNVSWGAYIQDNWRVNRRLTLNIGLRWDGVPHTYEASNRMSNFYPSLYNPANAPLFTNASDTQICGPSSGCAQTSPGLGSSPNAILNGYLFYLNGIGIDAKNGIPKGLVDNHWAALGPRLGFAYDLTGGGKTVIRGGFGTMYERIQGNDVYNGGPNVPFSSSASGSNVLLSNPHLHYDSQAPISAATLPILPASITGLDRSNYRLPVSYQFNLGVQQALNAKSVLAISYVGNQNRNQSDFREINLPQANLLPTLTGALYNTSIPYKGFRGIRLAENVADAHYNSLQVDLHTTLRELQLQFGYTLSKAVDPTTGNGGNGYDLDNLTNPYVGWQYDNGPSVFDRRHIAFFNFVYDVPFLRNSSNRFLKGTVGGWQISGIVTMESGAPLNITESTNNNVGFIQNTAGNRPDLVAPIKYTKKVVNGKFQWFDPTSFALPSAGQWGNLGHDALRGPGRDNWNLALFKNFTFTERLRFELRAETFNTWNHLQYRGDVAGGGIGQSHNGSDFGNVTAAFDPRTMQLGGKIIF